MRKVYYFLFSSIIVFFFIFLARTIVDPNQATIGPHQVYGWSSNEIIDFPSGTYELASNDEVEPQYFEIKQKPDKLIQSVFQPPADGKKYGQYVIREANLTGKWQISGPARVWTSKDTVISVDFTPGTTTFLIGCTIIVFILFILLLAELFLT